MYLFEVGLGVAVALGLFVAISSYWLLVRALWPAFVAGAERRFTERPAMSVLTGLPLAVLFAVGDGKLIGLGHPLLRVAGLLLAALAVGFTLAGAAGVAARVGEGVASARDEERPWARLGRGGLILLASCLVPAVGWFVILPVMLLGGLGAGVLSLARRGERSAAAPAVRPAHGGSGV